MKQLWILGVASVACFSLPLVAEAAVFNYSVPLEPSQEVPPRTSSATGNATGTLTGTPTDWVFSYTVNYSDLSSPLTDGHIHFAPRGTNGPIVHFLDNIADFRGTTAGTIVGDWTSADVTSPAQVFNNFLANNYYFNIHSQTLPGGEIRGQIDQFTPVPEPSLILGLLSLGLLQATSLLKKRK